MNIPTVNDEFFIRMMLPIIKKEASSYNAEEKNVLLNLLTNLPNKALYQLVVIGSGALSYVDVAISQHLSYVAIEPLIDFYIQSELLFLIEQKHNITIIPKTFGDFPSTDLNKTNRVFLFTFNVFAYIGDAIEKINRYINTGDIIFVSTWNLHSNNALKIRKKYFDYINKSMMEVHTNMSEFQNGEIYNLDNFDCSKLNYYTNNQRIKGEITDVLIIQV